MRQSAAADVERAVAALGAGEPVLVHDAADREGEVDVVQHAAAVEPADLARLRNDAGGLVCVALSAGVADAFGLPFVADAVDHAATEDHDLSYDDRSSFSLSVNHRETETGVTDADRARTVRALGAAAAEVAASWEATAGVGGDGVEDADSPGTVAVADGNGRTGGPDHAADFAATFRSPGHVHLLRAADGLLGERRGHTELAVALAGAAGLAPAVVLAEMLDDETGGALSTADARAYAERHGLVYVEGSDVVAELG